jgi:hypothetical protein
MVHDHIRFEELLHKTARKVGYDLASEGFDSPTAERICGFIEERARQAWQEEFWPWGVTRTERRQFAADWAAGTTYAAGAVVLSPDLSYFEAVGASTGEDPDDDAAGTYWTPVGSDFVRRIAYDQAWETEAFCDVQDVYEADPRVVRRAMPLKWDLDQLGIVVYTDQPRVYARLRSAPPRFGLYRLWAADGIYSPGDLVFHEATGDCMLATAVEDAAWKRQELPRQLAAFVAQAAAADEMAARGELERSMVERRAASAMLEDLVDRTFAGQGEQHRAFVEL